MAWWFRILTGRGAAELVRFWGEPPLVREPDLALFGVARLDPAEEKLLATSPLRRYLARDVQRQGAAAAAHAAIDRIHGNGYQFVLHFDVDVIAGFFCHELSRFRRLVARRSPRSAAGLRAAAGIGCHRSRCLQSRERSGRQRRETHY